jgi:hypothetical protein
MDRNSEIMGNDDIGYMAKRCSGRVIRRDNSDSFPSTKDSAKPPSNTDGIPGFQGEVKPSSSVVSKVLS